MTIYESNKALEVYEYSRVYWIISLLIGEFVKPIVAGPDNDTLRIDQPECNCGVGLSLRSEASHHPLPGRQECSKADDEDLGHLQAIDVG